jgi:hypothetical protein
LLPVSPRFLVPHQEVLVIDPSQMEMQSYSVNSSLKHQTGVTKRSIGRNDG